MSGSTVMGCVLVGVALTVLAVTNTRPALLTHRGPLLLLLPMERVGLLAGALLSALRGSAPLAVLVTIAAAVFWWALTLRARALVDRAGRQRDTWQDLRARRVHGKAAKGIDRR